MIPSKQLLAQFKFRPWNGVYFSDEFLSSVERAEAITAQLLATYHCERIIPLVESKVSKEEHLQRAVGMLAHAAGVDPAQLLPGLQAAGRSGSASKSRSPKRKPIDQEVRSSSRSTRAFARKC